LKEQKLFFLYGKKFVNITFCTSFLNFQ